MNITSYLLTNVLNGLLGIALLIIGYKLFDWMTPKWEFYQVFNSEKITNGAFVICAFLIALAIIIAFSAS